MPYLRFLAELRPARPVESLDVALVVEDATGAAFFTDVMLQDGGFLTAWEPHTQEVLRRARDASGNPLPVRHYCAVGRGPMTLVLPNRGEVTSGLDVTVRASEPMPRLSLAHEFGAHRTTAPAPAAEAVLAATTRAATLDGQKVPDWGSRFLFAPAVDAKFEVDPEYRADLSDPPQTPPARPHMRVFASLKEWVPGPERF